MLLFIFFLIATTSNLFFQSFAMPPKSNYYKRYAKKSTTKPYSKYKNNSKLRAYKAKSVTTMVSRGVRPLAQRFITTMKYVERVVISTTLADLPAVYMFNLNSIYDPNRTGLGHQPFGHDTFSGLYSRYRVFAADYSVTALPNNANAGTLSVIVKNDSASVFPLDPAFAAEYPRSKTIYLRIQDPSSISGSISLPSLVGQTPAQYKAEDRYASTFLVSPTELMTLQLYLTLASASQITCDVTINYHVELFDPIAIAQS